MKTVYSQPKFTSLKANTEYYYNRQLNISCWEKSTLPLYPNSVTDPWVLHKSKRFDEYYLYNTETGISQWGFHNTDNCRSKEGLKNKENSCYLDSIFQLLCATNNLTINTILYSKEYSSISSPFLVESLQNEIRKIFNFIRGIYGEIETDSDRLRSIFSLIFTGNEEVKWTHEMGDASEFLILLLTLFPQTETLTGKKQYLYTNEELNEDQVRYLFGSKITDDRFQIGEKDIKTIPIITIDSFEIKDPTVKSIADYTSQFTYTELSPGNEVQNKYNKIYSYSEYYSSQSIFFVLERRDTITGKILKNFDLDIPESFIMKDMNRMVLSGVVLYTGSHYYCYYKCKDKWYRYNDILAKTVTPIKEFKINKEVRRQVTIIFYTLG